MGFNDDYQKLRKKRLEEQKANSQNVVEAPLFVNKTAAFFSDDIAPVPTRDSSVTQTNAEKEDDERKWFQKGEFEDGYQFGDVTKTLFASDKDLADNFMAGVLGIGEKVVDAGAYVAGLFGGEDFKKKTSEFIAKDLYDEKEVATKMNDITMPSRWIRKLLGTDTEEDSVFGDKSDAIAQSGGQLIGTIGLQSVGVPWYVTSGVTSFGSEAESAFNEGATYGEAGFSAAISAGAEILTEKMFGGSGLGEKGLINLEPLTKGISNKVVKALFDLGIDMAAEGSEEVVTSVFSRLGSALYKEENLGEILASEEAFDEYLESFIGGAALGGGMNVGKVVNTAKTGRDYRTDLTANEEKVVNKVYEDAIAEAEKDGEKLSAAEKTKLYDSVLNQLEKGYIDTDTIEEVVGGDYYKTYKDTIDNEDAILKKFEELGNKQNPTLAEQSLYAELSGQVKDIKENPQRDALKEQLSKDVYGLVKGSKLAESYHEGARRRQAFTADLTKYDAKQQEVVKRAIDSGILNNTNKSHEFVDFVAKVSADKSVPFDFANNAKLKESGFAIEGKTVNGFVTKDGVTVNIDSHKALNSVVGHEITHVLEGTELYGELQKALFNYAQSKGDYQGRYDTLAELYKGVTEDIESELTADLVGDYLFTDRDFINHLSSQNRNVFQKIYDEIKYLWKVATAGSKEARELERVKKLFDEAYRSNATKSETGIKYSMSDSNGKQLTAEQSEYFKDSKVRDENGNLKAVYHGSPNDFNTFSLEYLGTNGTAEGYGFYFTDSKRIAEGYSKGREGQQNGAPGKLFEVYLDIKKPLSDTEVTMSRSQFKDLLIELNNQVDEDGEPLEFLSNYGDVEWEGLNKVLNYAMEIEYDGSDSDVNMVHSIINACGNKELVFDLLRKVTGYDGIIVNEATWGGDQTIYLAFHPEQIKNVDNLNPTNNPDTRYSLSGAAEAENIDTNSSVGIDNGQELVYNGKRGDGYARTDEFRRLQEESRGMSAEEWNFYLRGGKNEVVRRRVTTILRRQIDSWRSSGGFNNGSVTLTGKNSQFNMYEDVEPSLFHDVFEVARKYLTNGELVDLHEIETTEDGVGYNDCYNYLSDDGLSGFSITPDGDLISVFNASDKGGFLRAISGIVKEKAKTLDCYASPQQNLMGMYEYFFGFKTASVMDYNMDYDHDNIAENHGMPQIAFMVNTEADVETKSFTKDQYDEAVTYRNGFFAPENIETKNSLSAEGEAPVRNANNIYGEDIRFDAPVAESVDNAVADNRTTSSVMQEDIAPTGTQKSDARRAAEYCLEEIKRESEEFGIDFEYQKMQAQMEQGNMASSKNVFGVGYHIQKKSNGKYVAYVEGEGSGFVANALEVECDTFDEAYLAIQEYFLEQNPEGVSNILKENENVAPMQTETPEGFAPTSEEDANAMQSQNIETLTDADAPTEAEAPFYGESENATPSDPFADRDIKEVGNPKVKAYVEENPDVLPYFQEAANAMLGDLRSTVRGERQPINDADGYIVGWNGTKRQTTDDIAYLLDTLHYKYEQIENALNSIIEGNGKYNAAAKKIEFLLNDRLMKGYTDISGYDIPANQDYINLLSQKQTADAVNQQGVEASQHIADNIAPVQDAPVVEEPVLVPDSKTPVIDAPIKEAPVKEAYEAIKPQKQTEAVEAEAEPRMRRVDSEKKPPHGMEERSWFKTSSESEAVDGMVTPDDIPDDVRFYQIKSNKKTLETANARLAKDGYAKSREYFEGRMSERKLSVEDIALGERLIQEAVKAGDAEAVRDLIIDVSILGTELGQRVQALSIIQRLTPEGQLKALIRTVERGKAKGDKAFEGVEVTEDMTKQILDTKKEDGTFDKEKLDDAVEDVKQQIADQMSVSALDYINAWRYLSMLGNPKTHIRNIVSNVAMFGTRSVKNAIARTIEDIAPIKNRTKTWRRATDAVKKFAAKTTTEQEAVIKGDNKYSDEGSIKDKRKIFKTSVANAANNANTSAMEWEDAIFSKNAYRTTLQEYLTANGIKTEADIKNNPEIVAKAKEYALEESRKATFRQDSFFANKISEIERKNPFYGVAVGSVMPFKRTPINIAKTGVAYSPLGFARNIYDAVQVKKGNMDASEAIDHLAQTLTGTSLTLIGFALAEAGLLNGAGDDDKEGKYDYQLGEQSYSFNFGGDTYALSWLSPVAMPLFVGANAYEKLVEKSDWDMNVVVDTLAQTLDPLSEMSFLSSLDDVLSSYDSGIAKFMGAGESMVQNYATQFIPTLSSQIASTFDDTKRSTKASGDSGFEFGETMLNKIKYKIPGLRNTLEPTTDIWGNEAKQTDNALLRGFESFLSPANKREGISTAVDDELKALYGEVGKSEILPAIPDDYINYEGAKYDMSAKDYTEYKQTYGQTAYDLMERLFNTETYKNASPDERADMVADVYDFARDAAKDEYFTKFGVDYTNATSEGEKVFKENPIKGAIEADLPVDEYRFSTEYPEKYSFFKQNGISYADYKAADEDGKRAYSWAYENPGKYTLSKAVADDFLTFYEYKSAMSDFDAKDASGKTVSGLKKERVTEYINGLDLDYGQKIILYRSMYDSSEDKSAYNYEIIDYLNNREDISYDEMVTILKELGFIVRPDGRVTW